MTTLSIEQSNGGTVCIADLVVSDQSGNALDFDIGDCGALVDVCDNVVCPDDGDPCTTEFCNLGSEHLCKRRALLGMNKPIVKEGGLAEFIAVPDTNLNNLPENLDIKKAAISEPTAVSLHAVLMGETSSKKPLKECRTLVQGAGAIGLLCSLILSKIHFFGNKCFITPSFKIDF